MLALEEKIITLLFDNNLSCNHSLSILVEFTAEIYSTICGLGWQKHAAHGVPLSLGVGVVGKNGVDVRRAAESHHER